ncbi:cytochrome c [Mesobacterium sp. TK19101]|uniref:Cytochrome c n=1 Tax=Mesobacterium hydrothermale TaxID=3111907 RepID=A0ABU6HLS3_9RHOB|nr:cytochrome c [Mesobacterium sp. TK19101]MEC3863403.1 cytochrome c [Mesobacterium sp. TK19101]
MSRTLLGALIALFGTPVAAEDALLGETLANTCAGCHGTMGVPAVPYIPPLAGLTNEEFIRAMEAYQDGTRQATMMNRIAPAFSDEEIKAMADYFAALPRPDVTRSTIRNRPGN